MLEACSSGDPAPSGVGMKSSNGISLSFSPGGAGESVTGGARVLGKYSCDWFALIDWETTAGTAGLIGCGAAGWGECCS